MKRLENLVAEQIMCNGYEGCLTFEDVVNCSREWYEDHNKNYDEPLGHHYTDLAYEAASQLGIEADYDYIF